MAGSRWLPSQPASAAAARALLRAELASARLPDEVLADAELITSELVSNAVLHARPLPEGIRLRWECDAESVRILVTDAGGRHEPEMRHAGTSETNGRGLAIVEALSAEWGTSHTAEGSTTWAALHVGCPVGN